MKRKILIPILLLTILLSGCHQTSEMTAPSTQETTQATTAATEPVTQAPTETTEPTTEATTEPPLVLDPGPGVYVNGIAITETAMDAGTVYVSANEFCLALDGSLGGDGSATLVHQGETYTFSPEYEHMSKGGKAIVLMSPVLCYQEQAYLPLEELCQMLELSVYWDTEYNTVYCTAAAWPREIPAGYDVPVLMYHAVDNDLWGIAELFVRPERMEEQLQYLTENGYDTIFFEDLYHIEDYDKPVILTFDDGYLDNYTQLFPLLQKYNAKATIFVITQYIGNDIHYTNQDQLREMADSGLVSIQSHTVTHPDLDELSLEQQRQELEQSKLLTTRMTLREPYVLCYPTGKYNKNTLAIIGDSYQFGIKMRGNLYNTSDSPFEINRYYISRDTGMDRFKSILRETHG